MYCPYCGTEISSAAGFCPECGNKLGEDAGVPEEYRTPLCQPAEAVSPAQEQTQLVMPESQVSPEVWQGTTPSGTAIPAAVADQMPNLQTCRILIGLGFLLGILWGVIGLVQYGPLKRAVEEGDLATAKSKAAIIRGVAIAGGVVTVVSLAISCTVALGS